jgi:mRNA interferase MazF
VGIFTIGDVVLIPFPYADFTTFKMRPALVIAQAEFDNLVLCQITSKANTSKRALSLTKKDFLTGTLPVSSFIRPDKLFTIEPRIIETTLGKVSNEKISSVKAALKDLFS